MRGGILGLLTCPWWDPKTKYTEFTLIQGHASGTRGAQGTRCSGCAAALEVTR